MSSPWHAVITAYLICGVLYAQLNMRSRFFSASARNLDRHGLAWTTIPMILLSAALWPLWMALGYFVKWWLIRKIDQENQP